MIFPDIFGKTGPQLMSYQRPNNRGIQLGRVVKFNPQTREVTISLEEPLALGDGYEIWVTKGDVCRRNKFKAEAEADRAGRIR